MSEFVANHSMENFFINPTMTQDTSMETFARISIVGEPTPKTRIDELPLTEGTKEEKARPMSTIQELFFSPTFLTSYHSEEELASPRDSSESLSMHSDDYDLLESPLAELDIEKSEPSAIGLFLVPEELANSCQKIEHRCNRAQAVTLKPVGKPRMVSMPKVVELKPGQFKRLSTENFKSTLLASARRTESRKSLRPATSTKVSFEHPNPAPSIPFSVLPTPDEVTLADVVREPITPLDTPKRQPSVPLLRAASAFDSFPKLSDIASGVSRKDMSVKRSMTASSVPELSRECSPISPAKRRLHRLASSISNASDIVRRKSSVSSLRKSASVSARPSLIFDKDGPHTPMGPIPKRRSSMGKLTPRGATERAPILVLPPFPDDEEEDDDFGDASSDQALTKWDRPRARQAAKIGKQRPSIDGIVARST